MKLGVDLHQKRSLSVPTRHIIHITDVFPFRAKHRNQVVLLFGRHDAGTKKRRIANDIVKLYITGSPNFVHSMNGRTMKFNRPILNLGFACDNRRSLVRQILMDINLIGINGGHIVRLFPHRPIHPQGVAFLDVGVFFQW